MLTDTQLRYKLRKCNEKEVKVEEEFKLLIKNDRKEGEDIVFLIPNYVWRKFVLKFL